MVERIHDGTGFYSGISISCKSRWLEGYTHLFGLKGGENRENTDWSATGIEWFKMVEQHTMALA